MSLQTLKIVVLPEAAPNYYIYINNFDFSLPPSLPPSPDKVVTFESTDTNGQFIGFSDSGCLKAPNDTNNEERQFLVNVVGEVRELRAELSGVSLLLRGKD